MIIDFHTHTYPKKIAEKTVQHLSDISRLRHYHTGSEEDLFASMENAGISWSLNHPVYTDPGQTEKLNTKFIQNREEYLAKGIVCFGGIHPDNTDYKKELHRLKENHIPGIKLHGAYQDTMMDDIRYMRIIDCACEEGLIVIVHAGLDMAFPGVNFCSLEHIFHILDEVHPEKLVLAHMGNWGCWDDVERDLAGAPVWFDTSFSCGVIRADPKATTAPDFDYNMHEDQFYRICKKHGTDHILFGTDSPWTDQKESIEQIESMPFTEEEKKQIFSENAIELLGMPQLASAAS